MAFIGRKQGYDVADSVSHPPQRKTLYRTPFYHLKCYRSKMVLSKDNVTEGTMPTEKQMTLEERRKYLSIMRLRYQMASRKGRNQLLTEMEQVTGLHRKTMAEERNVPVATFAEAGC